MAYRIMKTQISRGIKTKDELLNMADVYYGAGRMSDAEYEEVIKLINEKYSDEA